MGNVRRTGLWLVVAAVASSLTGCGGPPHAVRPVPPDQALSREDHVPHRNIYVRGTEEELHSVQDVSRKVRRLIMR